MQGVLSAELLSHFQESLKNMERFYKRCCLGLDPAASLLLDINHGIHFYSWHFFPPSIVTWIQDLTSGGDMNT